MIWQLNKERKKKRKRIWKTLNNSVIAILEDAYQGKKMDVKVKNLAVSALNYIIYISSYLVVLDTTQILNLVKYGPHRL